jgi:hypothetical protein
MSKDREEDAGLKAFDETADVGAAITDEEAIARLFEPEGEDEGDPGLEAFDEATDRPPLELAPAAPAKPVVRRKGKRRKKGGSAYARERQARERPTGQAPAAPPKKPAAAPAPAAVEPIPPELVGRIVDVSTGWLLRRMELPELDAAELAEAGTAWGPVLDHYFPAIAARVGIWGAPIAWAVSVTAPRIELAVELRREKERRARGAGFPEQDPGPTPAMVVTPAHGGTPGPVVTEEALARRRGAARAEQVT